MYTAKLHILVSLQVSPGCIFRSRSFSLFLVQEFIASNDIRASKLDPHLGQSISSLFHWFTRQKRLPLIPQKGNNFTVNIRSVLNEQLSGGCRRSGFRTIGRLHNAI